MTPSVPLIAHYNGQTGNREVSLRIIAITVQNVMLVLWDSKLIPVHQPIPGLTLDRVEEERAEPPFVIVNTAKPKPPKVVKTPEGE